MKTNEQEYQDLVKTIQGYIKETITREEIEKEIYGHLRLIDDRAVNAKIKRLYFDNVIKPLVNTKPMNYAIQRPDESGE